MRSKRYGLNLVAVAVLAVFAAACSTDSESTSGTMGSGGGGGGSQVAVGAPTTAVTPGTQKDLEQNVGHRVYFDFDRYSLKPQARQTLERQAAWLKQHPNVTITIEGNADERGTREYNLALGERRANSAKDYLVSLGIDPARISTISYGKERPIALCSNESCWSQNRNATTVIN